MRTVAKEKTSPVASEGGASAAPENGNSGSWFRTHWCLISLFVIIAVSFILRFAFAYGVSAGDNYALSGGSSASSHLRIVTEILAGTYDPANQITINYPYGSGSISGPLFDYIIAAFAYIVTLCGVSQATAAAGTLAWSAPIFGALTCIPVYLLGRKLFKDEKIGLLAAVFYALFPLMIMTTAFSNGTENAFVCFLMVWFVYFVVKTLEAVDAVEITGVKQVFSNEPVRTYVLFSAVFLAFLVLSWTGFWTIIACAAAIMFVTLLFRRIGRKDLLATVVIGSFILLVGVGIGAIYYIPLGLWSPVFQGGCLLAVLVVVYSVLFLVLEKQPWVLSIPLTIVVIVAVAAVLAVFAPSVSSALLHGSSPQVGALATDLAHQFSRTSISSMAAYYGWMTVWFPLALGVWMAYKYRANAKSHLYTFLMLWLFCCFFIGWFSADYAVVAGAGFAVGSAALVVMVFRAVDLKAYLKSLRGLGVKGGLKKAFDFFPLVTLLVAVCLVAAPAAVYAADAATPTNNEHANYFGGLGYTINTNDSSMVNATWNSYSTQAKAGALMSWYGYSDAASSVGGFSTVTSSVGGGTSAMASAYLSAGSAGAIASFIIRLAESNPDAYSATFTSAGVPDLVKYIKNPADARAYMSAHVDKFVAYNTNVHDESLPYIVGVSYLTENLGENQLADLYNKVRAVSGNTISYIEVDGSMLPTYYGDGSYTSTIGYYGDYVSTQYDGLASLYEVSSTTQMYYQYGGLAQLYYNYLDGMYETFLWNALIGVTPSQYGLTSTAGSSNLTLFEALANSDGTVKAQPAAGMSDFTVSYWHVKYRANDNADWVDMDANAALAKQKAEGGYINYLASVVVLEYNSTARTAISGTVTSTEDISGLRVAVFEKDTLGASGATSYIQRSTTHVNADGTYTVSVPTGTDYVVRYYVGSTGLRDGTLYKTFDSVQTAMTLSAVAVSGNLTYATGAGNVTEEVKMTFTGSNGNVVSATFGDSAHPEAFSADLLPDVYTVKVYSKNNTALGTSTVSVVDTITGLTISAGMSEIKVTVNDVYGAALTEAAEVTFIDASGNVFTRSVANGSASVYLNAGEYSAYIGGKDSSATKAYVSTETKTVTAGSSAGSVTFTVCEATKMTSSAGTVYSTLGYTTVSGTTDYYVPSTLNGKLTALDSSKAALNGTLTYNNNGVAGTVAFIKADAVYQFAAGTDGKFSATVDAGDYTVYAKDSSGHVKIGTVTAAEGMSIALDNGNKYTAYVSMYPFNTTVGLPFVPLTFTVNDSFTIPAATGADGKFVLSVPSGATVKYAVAAADLTGVYGTVMTFTDYTSDVTTVSGDSTVECKIDRASSTTATNKINDVSKDSLSFVDSDGNPISSLTIKFSTYEATISSGAITDLKKGTDAATGITPGTYYVTVKDPTDVFINSQSIKVYPNTSKITLETVNCFKLEYTLGETSDSISIVAVKDADGKQGATYRDTNAYLVEDGFEYYFKVTNGDKVAYSQTYSAAGSFSGYTLENKVTVSGYVGSKAAGTVKAVYDTNVNVIATLSEGSYSLDLPAAKVVDLILNASTTNGGYVYKATDVTFADDYTVPNENAVRNASVNMTRTEETGVIAISSASFSNGTGTVTLTVENKNDYSVTYFVNGSDAFILDKTYVVTLDKLATSSSITVTGFYNENTVGAGNTGVSISVTDSAGTNVATKVIPRTASWTGVTGDLTWEHSTDTNNVHDSVDGYSYKYALVFHNGNTALKSATVTATVSDADAWNVSVTDADGYLVQASGSAFELNGLGDTTLYVVISSKTGSSITSIPNVELTVGGDVSGTATLAAATGTLNETEGSASGDKSDNNKAGLAPAFWIFTVLTILMFLILLWSGMKRGVFSRRN